MKAARETRPIASNEIATSITSSRAELMRWIMKNEAQRKLNQKRKLFAVRAIP